MSKWILDILTLYAKNSFILSKRTSAITVRLQSLSGSARIKRTKKMEHLQSNPFYEKYAKKLKDMQESSKDEFNSRLASLLEEKKLEMKDSSKEKEPEKIPENSLDTLNSLLNIDRIEGKSAEDIALIWKKYFEGKDAVYAVILAEEYRELSVKTKEFPLFVYPLPRGEGYEFFMQLWNNDVCHFTPLSSYQMHKENAPVCLSLKHYTELAANKDIVLMVGTPDMNILSVQESQLLALQVKLYYGIQSALKFNHVRVFNNSPSTFEYRKLITEFENYKRDVKSKQESS